LKNLASSFCHALKKSFSFVTNSDGDNVFLDTSPDLMETISNLENEKLIGTGSGATHAHCLDKHWICEDFLNFFSAVPGFHANSKAFIRLINYILHLERQVWSLRFCSHVLVLFPML
jgi:hypothetical protein